jgi:hypothetical protein
MKKKVLLGVSLVLGATVLATYLLQRVARRATDGF